MTNLRATSQNHDLIRYAKRAERLATHHRVDLQELKWATKYLGRNIGQLNANLNAGLSAILIGQDRMTDELSRVNAGLDRLVNITAFGIRLTLVYLGQISSQLHQILEVLKYPTRTQASELRERGIFLAGKGKPSQAVQNLQKAIIFNECDFISLYALGAIFASNKQYKLAAPALDDCALYADDSPALSAEAAILAASCYGELGENHKAWSVLCRTLATKCPDLALPLAKYAASEADHETAVKYLSEAFVIDAELVLAAEELELSALDEAIKLAQKTLADQGGQLETAWHELSGAATSVGIVSNRKIPAAPEARGSLQGQVMNAAIYRRRLQIVLTGLVGDVRDRLANPPQLPPKPATPDIYFDGPPVRFAAGIVVAAIGFGLLHIQITFFAFIAFILALGLGGLEALALVIGGVQWIGYGLKSLKARQKAQYIKLEIERFDALKPAANVAIKTAEEALTATLPPVVPRAFTSDVIGYAKSA